jgi:hypothetical protein
MSKIKRRRRLRAWTRYERRYITWKRGGYINNARPIGAMKALYRAYSDNTHIPPWSWSDAYWTRRAR